MSTETRVHRRGARWVVPGFFLLVGIAYMVAAAAGGKLQLGLEMFGLMVGFAVALLVFGGRSETIRGLTGEERDERFAMLDLRASAYTGVVLITIIVGGFIYELARGRNGGPYLWLAVTAGVTYLATFAILRRRS